MDKHRPHCRRAAGLATVMALASSLACAQAPASVSACAPSATLNMPSGISVERIKMLDDGQHFKVYTSVEAADDRDALKDPLPPGISRLVDMNPSTLNRELADVILRSRRFKVFDMRSSVTAEHSDVLVTAKILGVSQKLVPLEGGRRVSASAVTLSVQIKNMLTGENLLASDAQVEGRTGLTSGDRVLITAADDLASPRIQRELADDIRKALFRAFQQADERIESLLRPMARVESAGELCSVDLFGGSRNGLQREDELIVFRTQKKLLGQTVVLSNTRPVALVRCSGVGDDVSQCKVVQSASGLAPQEGDYAILTEQSMQRTREQ